MIRLLAIDDDTDRYDGLRRLLGERVVLDVASCRECVARLLPSAAAVLLDYDLDSGEPCSCGRPLIPAKGPHMIPLKATDYVPQVAASGLPTVIVSASHPENVRLLRVMLSDAGQSVRLRTVLSVVETDPEIRWLGWLWAAGVL